MSANTRNGQALMFCGAALLPGENITREKGFVLDYTSSALFLLPNLSPGSSEHSTNPLQNSTGISVSEKVPLALFCRDYLKEKFSGPGFDGTTDPNFGVDLVDFTPVVVTSATDVLLPVHRTTVSAITESKSVRLQWSTANEQNSKGFEVERSQEQATGFKWTGWISNKSSNAGNNDYSFIDMDVAPKVTYYYRLKQVDNNGNFMYSNIRTARLTAAGDKGLRIMPNPVGSVLQVFFEDAVPPGNISLKIVTAKGAVLLQQHIVVGPKVFSASMFPA